jgi:hypothetical protein
MPSNDALEKQIYEIQSQLLELTAKHEELAALFGRVVGVVQEMKGSEHHHVRTGAGDRAISVREESSNDSLGEPSE